MKQTAVEWLISKIEVNSNPSLTQKEMIGYIEQAKEMERQQIIDAHGIQTKHNAGVSNYIYQLSGEKYYEQTFKQES
jgi:hypothetical protein